MTIRFCRRWRHYVADRECEMSDGVANVLIRKGYARCVTREPQQVRTVIVEPDALSDIFADGPKTPKTPTPPTPKQKGGNKRR